MEKSCAFNLVHSSTIGSVHVCASCRNLKIEIGSLLALISQKSFQLIMNDFIERRNFYQDEVEEYQLPERVVICLNKENLFLNLSPSEFNELIDLFEMTAYMLEVNQILDLTE